MIRYLIVFIALVAGAHAATLWYLPRLAMNTAMSRLASVGATPNTIAHVPPTDETSRRVVRPSPDLLYSVCLLNLADGPVQIRAADWGGYMSLSVFAGNTDNVAAVNEMQASGDIILSVADGGGADVDLGGPRGIAIIRRLVTNTDALTHADAVRRQDDSCEALEPS
ncbi:DUF1254 domain-containing protein [Hyphobacterium sp. CCMP332]|uniref:DUF1254 domain-containing protein n=1 Tax=Hyphobacterium sp. CCMP332 TaxID=2749086 RepID=UPI00164F93A9|nr:DUF1254 domain-containing protein [Hyphobacterium sp. CCMP332]QNL17966.1 DUF1254 domain-containing protein [Hyphobacterium sp. CCMP332]